MFGARAGQNVFQHVEADHCVGAAGRGDGEGSARGGKLEAVFDVAAAQKTVQERGRIRVAASRWISSMLTGTMCTR